VSERKPTSLHEERVGRGHAGVSLTCFDQRSEASSRMNAILTSSWFSKLPADHCRIGISRGTPSRQSAPYRSYRPLAPGAWFKSCATPEEYQRRYFSEILSQLDPAAVVAELQAMAGTATPTLLCWEHAPPSPAWCHRALVSIWLWDRLGLEVREYGCEGFGWRHPKLHLSLMR